MNTIKTFAAAGLLAVSTSFGATAHADTLGCSTPFTTNTAEAINLLQQAVAALENWLSNRTPADPNYATVSADLGTAQNYLTNLLNGTSGSKGPIPASAFACSTDVSPA